MDFFSAISNDSQEDSLSLSPSFCKFEGYTNSNL